MWHVVGDQATRRARSWVVSAVAFLAAFVALLAPTVASAADGQPRMVGVNGDRAVELVNPPNKNMNPVAWADPAPSGDLILYAVNGGLEGSTQASPYGGYMYAERTEEGWFSHSPLPDRATADWSDFQAAIPSADKTRFIATAMNVVGLVGRDQKLFERFGVGAPAPVNYVTVPSGQNNSLDAVGASDDLSKVAFTTTNRLLPEHPASRRLIYEADENGNLGIISRLPGSGGLADPIAPCNVYHGEGANSRSLSRGIVSQDGDLAYFHTEAQSPCATAGNRVVELFVREGGPQGKTKWLSGPSLDGEERGGTLLQGVKDGSAALFNTTTRLVPEDENTGNSQLDGDIYRYDFATSTSECLTCGFDAPASVAVGQVDFNSDADRPDGAVSEDGRILYFTSPNVLIEGEGVTDAPQHLYRMDVTTRALTYVAPMSSPGTVIDKLIPGLRDDGVWGSVSPHGEALLFKSSGSELDEWTNSENGGFAQLYRYSEARGVECVSCPAGRPASSPMPSLRLVDSTAFGGRMTPPMSDDGSVIAFMTSEALVQQDVNNGPDIYEWRNGEVALLTAGRHAHGLLAQDKIFGVTPSGRDIFFGSGDNLAPQVAEGEHPPRQLYTARIGGGFVERQQPAECTGDGCQGELVSKPEKDRPGSADYSGPGNKQEAATNSCTKQRRALRQSQRKSQALSQKARKRAQTAKLAQRRAKQSFGKEHLRLKSEAQRKRKVAKKAKRAAKGSKRELRSARRGARSCEQQGTSR